MGINVVQDQLWGDIDASSCRNKQIIYPPPYGEILELKAIRSSRKTATATGMPSTEVKPTGFPRNRKKVGKCGDEMTVQFTLGVRVIRFEPAHGEEFTFRIEAKVVAGGVIRIMGQKPISMEGGFVYIIKLF